MKPIALLAALGLFGCANPSTTDDTAARSGDALLDLGGQRFQPLTAKDSVQVLVFVTQDCPIANRYAPDLIALAKTLADRPVQLLLVHVDPDLEPAAAAAHASEYGYAGKIPVVLDTHHRWVSALRPEVTPEAFVLTDGKIRYRGRIDDRFPSLGSRRATAAAPDLRDAIEAVLSGVDPDPASTRAVGCRIPEQPTPRR